MEEVKENVQYLIKRSSVTYSLWAQAQHSQK